jgi:A/G-specific adenine glycosylase
LHNCAKRIDADFQALFPTSSVELFKLPGIGRYTSAAIASMAFGEVIPVIDGNVYRVLSRVFDISFDISQSSSYEFFHQISIGIIPQHAPGTYNQAVMEFGALQCVPKSPNCKHCVISDFCKAYKNGTVKDRPVKSKKVKIRKRQFNYLIFSHNDQLLVNHRSDSDIWQGLYDFYNIEGPHDELEVIEEISTLTTNLGITNFTINTISDIFKHKLTHQHLDIRFFEINIGDSWDFSKISESLKIMVAEREALNNLGKPIIVSNYLKNNY